MINFIEKILTSKRSPQNIGSTMVDIQLENTTTTLNTQIAGGDGNSRKFRQCINTLVDLPILSFEDMETTFSSIVR